MAKKNESNVDPNAWLNTYADMVTLLLTFFVLLLSMSSVDTEKWEMVVQAFQDKQVDKLTQIVIDVLEDDVSEPGYSGSQGGSTSTGLGDNELPENFDKLYKYISQTAEEHGLKDEIQVVKGSGFIYIRFKDNVFFNPDSSIIKEEGLSILGVISDAISEVKDEIERLAIDGHTASVPGMEDYKISDWKLSSERASEVAIFMEDRGAIEPFKLEATGYGKRRPIADNETVEGRSANRRVEMFIQKKDGANIEALDIYEMLDEDPSQYSELPSIEDDQTVSPDEEQTGDEIEIPPETTTTTEQDPEEILEDIE